MTVLVNRTVDLDLAPTRPTRQEFHRQIARLEHELSTALARLGPTRRPRVTAAPGAMPHLLNDAELETTRDSLVARLGEVEELVARQAADQAEARALLKRMSDAPAEYRWVSVTTKELGDDGCRTWQSVPVLGPIGMFGNWWRIRMSSGCP